MDVRVWDVLFCTESHFVFFPFLNRILLFAHGILNDITFLLESNFEGTGCTFYSFCV